MFIVNKGREMIISFPLLNGKIEDNRLNEILESYSLESIIETIGIEKVELEIRKIKLKKLIKK